MGIIERIKELCRAEGITITELEKMLGYGNGSLAKSSTIKSDRLQAIAKYFNVSIDYLVNGESYYLNESTAQLAEELATRPTLKVLFDASRDVPDESLMTVAMLLEQLKKTNPEG